MNRIITLYFSCFNASVTTPFVRCCTKWSSYERKMVL